MPPGTLWFRLRAAWLANASSEWHGTVSDLIDLLIKLIPVFPLLAVVVNGLFGHRYSHDMAHRLAWGSVGLSFLCTIGVFTDVMRTGASHEVIVYQWIFGGDLTVDLAYLVDPLTCAWLLVVTGVGFLIHVYSVGYMHGETGFTRFFTYMNLFMVSMLLLVMGNNYVVLFIGWEGVGLCSYLLIGYYYDKESAAKAASKAFVVNRIGDAGFLVAIFLVFINFKTLDYTKVFAQVGQQLSPDMATAIALCLLVGAIGKSAQLPLDTWLPDAMEGPPPVSALIHAATMVTAGVYMIVRNHAIFDLSPFAMSMVAFIGGGTALFAATIGLVQTDIKRVLAYSTVSQLGYMFLGWDRRLYGVRFHVATHAFFKALLFLSAGSVIHALSGEQDIRKMGGLSSRIPWTHRLFLTGTIAIAGLPP